MTLLYLQNITGNLCIYAFAFELLILSNFYALYYCLTLILVLNLLADDFAVVIHGKFRMLFDCHDYEH